MDAPAFMHPAHRNRMIIRVRYQVYTDNLEVGLVSVWCYIYKEAESFAPEFSPVRLVG